MHSNKNLSLPQSSPTLSVIVPMLNEAEILPRLFATLNRQEGIDFELILVDGGSADHSFELARELAATVTFPFLTLSSSRGRGVQMNAGAVAARGEYLLFIHADSTFLQPHAFRSGLNALRAQESVAVAARFSLSFAQDMPTPKLWRTFHTAKTRQNRRGCIHGDQGLLLNRRFFEQVGPFDESLPFLEDDRLSDKIFSKGRWILLPAEIVTSPRRFAAEGFWRQDFLNMIILMLHQSGYDAWLPDFAIAYRSTPMQKKIRITPALLTIQKQLRLLSHKEKRRFWIEISRCVKNNLWQTRLLSAIIMRRKEG